jgi:hypothetical protein
MEKMLESINKARSVADNGGDEISQGKLVFEKDKVWDTTHMFTALVRMIFIKEKITIQAIGHYMLVKMAKGGASKRDIGYKTGNILKSLVRPRPTFYTFYKVMCLLGYEMDITIKLKRNGKTVSYNYNELLKEFTKDRYGK